MKVAANFVLRFQQPEKEGLRYLSHAIANHYLQSMPVFKNTLLRDGRLIMQKQINFVHEFFLHQNILCYTMSTLAASRGPFDCLFFLLRLFYG